MFTDVASVASTFSSPEAPRGDLRDQEAARAFEGLLLEMMVREMRKTVPQGLLDSGAAELFSGLLDRAVADQVTQAGGLGLVDAIQGTGAIVSPSRTQASHDALHLPGGRRPVDGTITSRFGPRQDPFTGAQANHKGLDIAAPQGTPIQAAAGGVVRLAEQRSGYGNVVVLDHGGGWTTLYAHCEHLEVQPGQQVAVGETIGTVGSTGRSTGPHLHLEVSRDGQRVDPARALRW